MIRAREVRHLLFDWACEWRKGGEPTELNEIFLIIAQDGPFEMLCETVIGKIKFQDPELGPIQIGAVIASLFVMHTCEEQPLRSKILDALESAIDKNGQHDSPWFYQGCVLGLILSAVQLGRMKDQCIELEKRLWSIALRAAFKEATRELWTQKEKVQSRHRGILTNLIAEYLQFQDDVRRQHIHRAIVETLPAQLRNRQTALENFDTDEMLVILAKELLYRIFGEMRADQRLRMIVANLKACK